MDDEDIVALVKTTLEARRATRVIREKKKLSAKESAQLSVYPAFDRTSTESAYGHQTDIKLTSSEAKIPRPPNITSKNLDAVGNMVKSFIEQRKLEDQPGVAVKINVKLGEIYRPSPIPASEPGDPIGINVTCTDILTNEAADMMKSFRTIAMLAAVNHLRKMSAKAQDRFEDDDRYQPRDLDECTFAELDAQRRIGLNFNAEVLKEQRRKKYLANGTDAATVRNLREELSQKKKELREHMDEEATEVIESEIQVICNRIDEPMSSLSAGAPTNEKAETTRRGRLSLSAADILRASAVSGKFKASSGVTTGTDERGDDIDIVSEEAMIGIQRTLFWSRVGSHVEEAMNSEADPAVAVEEYKKEVDIEIARCALESAGISPAQYPLRMSTPDSAHEQVTDIISGIWVTIQHREAELREDRMLNSEEAKPIIRLIEKIKNMDYMVAAGGGIQLQRAYDMVYHSVTHCIGMQDVPEVKAAYQETSLTTVMDGSLVAAAIGVNERGVGYHEILDRKFNGPVTKDAVMSYLTQHRRMEMKPREKATDYINRVYHTIYVVVTNQVRRNHAMSKVITSSINEGYLDIVTTACVGIYNSKSTSAEMKDLARKQLSGVGGTKRKASTQEQMLQQYSALREKIRGLEEDELGIIQYGLLSSSPIKKGASFAGMAAEWGADEGNDQPEEKSEFELLSDKMESLMLTYQNMENKMTEMQALSTSAGQGSKGNSAKERDEKFWQNPRRKAIKDGGFRQLFTENGKHCNYCGGSDHTFNDCARRLYDLDNNQLLAHAIWACIQYREKKNLSTTRPAEGTFKPYPHGPRCFGPLTEAEAAAESSDTSNTKTDRERELEERLAAMEKKFEEKSEKAMVLDAEDEALVEERRMLIARSIHDNLSDGVLSDAALSALQNEFLPKGSNMEKALGGFALHTHGGACGACETPLCTCDDEAPTLSSASSTDGEDESIEEPVPTEVGYQKPKGNKKSRRKQKQQRSGKK